MGDLIGTWSESISEQVREHFDVKDSMSEVLLSVNVKEHSKSLSITSAQQADILLLSSLLSSGRAGSLVSERLVAYFGSFAMVISRSAAELYRFGGLTKGEVFAIKAVHAAALRLIRSEVDDRCIITDRQSLMDYVTASYSRDVIEIFHVIFLNSRNRLLVDEIVARGTVNHVSPYPREILKRAIELGATALILIHNHPSGDPTPSIEDIDSTALIVKLANALNIHVHDHIIISQNGVQSFRELGLLPCSSQYSINIRHVSHE